ncbi:MAG: hypothetical protein U0169_26050 [Polyangiaceae bacterium]
MSIVAGVGGCATSRGGDGFPSKGDVDASTGDNPGTPTNPFGSPNVDGGSAASLGDSGTGYQTCATFSAAATQEPATILFVLDASASMREQNKWGIAQQAIVRAIDGDVFDSMSLGLSIFPSGFVNPPQCLCDHVGESIGLPPPVDQATCQLFLGGLGGGAAGVSCGVSVLPQVPIGVAGGKSNSGSGTRSNLYSFLAAAKPLSNTDDGSPIYDALEGGYAALKAQSTKNRILVLITDGGFSCTSTSSRSGYQDLNSCPDWEYPTAVNELIAKAKKDAQKSIRTFVVGVPGSDSTGQKQGSFDTAPYAMKLALSTYAVSGSPETVDPTCDVAASFDPQKPAPAKPCHFDLTGGSFDATALESAIAQIRGKAIGCIYDLPAAPSGQSIDKSKVNVTISVGGTSGANIPKRSNPSDSCDGDGCWDYNANGQIELVGKSCRDVMKANTAKVDLTFGCNTVVK